MQGLAVKDLYWSCQKTLYPVNLWLPWPNRESHLGKVPVKGKGLVATEPGHDREAQAIYKAKASVMVLLGYLPCHFFIRVCDTDTLEGPAGTQVLADSYGRGVVTAEIGIGLGKHEIGGQWR